jgi:hypothetical protein
MSRSYLSAIAGVFILTTFMVMSFSIGETAVPPKVITIDNTLGMRDPQKVRLFVNELMTKRQASCLLWIFDKESHINPKAKNPKSSARGVGQLLESTYQTIGLKHSADPLAQVIASIAYISRHYGSDGACAAKAFWQRHSYY